MTDQNFTFLAFSNQPRTVRDAYNIACTATAAVRADLATIAALQKPDAQSWLESAERVVSVSVGKASKSMHEGIRIASLSEDGLVVSLDPPSQLEAGRAVQGSHPIPDYRSAAAAVAVLKFLNEKQLTSRDVVIVGLSGGASAMLAWPMDGLSMNDLKRLTRYLLLSGIDVTTINQIRQSISRIHGGGLLKMISPAYCLGLILCDNVQIGAAGVGSAPTYPPSLTYAQLTDLVEKHVPQDLLIKVQSAIKRKLGSFSTDLPATLNITVADSATAIRAAEKCGKDLGYDCIVLTDTLQGEARDLAPFLGAVFRYHTHHNLGNPVCIIAAGEATVTVNGNGQGGRCQELAWALAPQIGGSVNTCAMAFATDGHDYLESVGGAWVTGETIEQLGKMGLSWYDILQRNDTHSGLAALNQLIPSIETHTNVCDLYIICQGFAQ